MSSRKRIQFGVAIVSLFTIILLSGCTGSSGGEPQTSAHAPIAINSAGDPGWVRYTSSDNHFIIYRPSNWTVEERSESQGSNETNPDMSLSSNKIVNIYPPTISVGVLRDSNYYSINGNPARKVTLNGRDRGQTVTIDVYFIAHEHLLYVEDYIATARSTESDVSTASDIMRTFTIIA
jgi:hypothetical protein